MSYTRRTIIGLFSYGVLCCIGFAWADDSDFNVATALRDLRAHLGRDLTADDAMPIIMKLPMHERGAAWLIVVQSQRPPISKADLLAIHTAKRDALRSLQVTWREKKSEPGVAEQTKELEMGFSDGKFQSRWSPLAANGTVTSVEVKSYDGKTLRIFDRVGRATAGEITAFRKWSEFLATECNILKATKLFDSAFFYGNPLPVSDLAAFLNEESTAVFSQVRSDGSGSYVVVGNTNLEFLLDSAKEYAVVRFTFHQVADDGTRVAKDGSSNSDFREFENGLWLPMTMTKWRFNDNGGKVEIVGTVQELEVNGEIPDTYFTDIFPPGTLVTDQFRKISYFTGENGSIESMLNGELPVTKSVSTTVIVVLVNVVVFVAVVSVVVWRRRRRRVA